METFWFPRRVFRRAHDSVYGSDFWFSQGHNRSYGSAYHSDSVASVHFSLKVPLKFYITLYKYNFYVMPVQYGDPYEYNRSCKQVKQLFVCLFFFLFFVYQVYFIK